jgi:O-antigen/teichoic acid export membrane protein
MWLRGSAVESVSMSKSSGSRVAINTAVGAVARIVSMLVGFAVLPALVNSLGNTRFGVYAVIGSLTAYFGILDLGIGGGLTRYMTLHSERGEPSAVRQITTFGLLFYIAMACILLPVVALLAHPIASLLGLSGELAHVAANLVFVVFALFIGSSMSGVISARLISVHRLDIVTLVNLAANVLYAMLIIILVPRFRSLYVVFACAALQVLGVALGCYLFTRRLSPGLLVSPWKIEKRFVKDLFGFGMWTQINSISAIINLEADKLVIGRFLGVMAIAPYQVGNRLALLNRTLPLQFLEALLPDTTARISRGMSRQELADLYRDGSRSLMLATTVITGFIAASAVLFVPVWIGHPVPGAAILATALVVSYAVNNLTGLGTTIVKAEGKPRYETYYAIVSAGLNLTITLALVPFFGLYGVVGGTIIGNVLGSLYFLLLFHRLNHFGWWQTLGVWLLPLASGVVTASILTYFAIVWILPFISGSRLEQLALLIVSGGFYLLVLSVSLTVVRFWQPQDLDLVRKLRRKSTRLTS